MVQSVIFKGMHYEIIVESGDNEVVIQGTRGAKVGETIGMCLEPDGIHVILADTNQNIYEGRTDQELYGRICRRQSTTAM